MKRLILKLDEVFGDAEYPQTKYDVGGLGHYIVIDIKNKRKAVDEMCQAYRDLLWEEFKEWDENDE